MAYHSDKFSLWLEIAVIWAENLTMPCAIAFDNACRRVWRVILLTPFLCSAMSLIGPMPASAQGASDSSLLTSGSTPSGAFTSPGPNTHGDLFGLSGSFLGPSSLLTQPDLPRGGVSTPPETIRPPAGQVALTLAARFGSDAPAIKSGLIWRVFAAEPDAEGNFKLVKEDRSPAPVMTLPPGAYVVHVGFGLATAVKPVRLRADAVHEEFDLPAGGLRIEGRVGDTRIPSSQVSFEIYKGSQFDGSERRPIAAHVLTGDVIIVPEGIYYIVSNYGDANAVLRSDIRVRAGKLTDVTVTHHAAAITLKLVSEQGGEALANTTWSVLTPGGDVVKESIGAFPRVILAEGEYRAIARYDGKIYQREFNVATGVDGDVEVLAK